MARKKKPTPRRKAYLGILYEAVDRYGISWRRAQQGWRKFNELIVGGGYRSDFPRIVDLDYHPRLAKKAFVDPEEEEEEDLVEIEIAVDYEPELRRK